MHRHHQRRSSFTVLQALCCGGSILLFLCDCGRTNVLALSSFSNKHHSQRLHLQDNNQRIDRRKSPALWRLLYNDEEDFVSKHTRQVLEQEDDEATATLPAHKPEIMAPAGGWPQLKAAVANGANAVYLGLSSFSARARAANFDPLEDLPRAVDYCHQHSVHVYVALNTLVFDRELQTELPKLLQACYQAGVDAVICQDLGLCRWIQHTFNSNQLCLPIHASTQQSVTSADGVAFCHEQHGATRVVLGRELSVTEIAHVAKAAHDDDVELETFVHGALCVSYSGQCFSSEAWGGRSANRGQCAQACRLPYQLIVDKDTTDTGNPPSVVLRRQAEEELKYVLSPQDLCGLEQVPALVRAGVACLKIEGRLKDATYVAATTRAYRHAVDQAWNELHPEQEDTKHRLSFPHETVSQSELVQLFSRGQDEEYDGLTPGFLHGTHHQELVRGRSPRHRGVHVGRVVSSSARHGWLVLETDLNDNALLLKRGDGLVIDRGRPQELELGGAIFDVQSFASDGNRVQQQIQFGRDVTQQWQRHDQNDDLAPAGAHVWRTHDAAVTKKFRRLSQPLPATATGMAQVQIRVEGSLGKPLRLILTATRHQGNHQVTVSVDTPTNLERAQTAANALSLQAVEKAIGTLGNTDFVVVASSPDSPLVDFGALNVNDDLLWCPVSQIKQARRLAVEQLKEKWQKQVEEEEVGKVGGAIQLTSEKSPPAVATANVDATVAPHEYLHQQVQAFLSQQEGDEHENTSNDDDDGLFSVLCRNYEQVDAICSMLESQGDEEATTAGTVSEIVVDFLEVDGMKDAVQRIRSSGSGVAVVVASPRILKPEEGGIWKTLLALEPDALLVRSTGLLHRLQAMGGTGATVNVAATAEEDRLVRIPKLHGDFSLNTANALTAFELLTYNARRGQGGKDDAVRGGLDRITASYDLNAKAIADMAVLLGSQLLTRKPLEVVVHCKMPVFHTEHCVFARFLTKGNSYVDCGHACTRHSLHLRDENTGLDNLVLADMGCRNTVFAAQAQSGVHSLRQWKQAGIRRFRIELVDEGPRVARSLVQTYVRACQSDIKASTAWDILQKLSPEGVVLGSLKNAKERRAGEVSTPRITTATNKGSTEPSNRRRRQRRSNNKRSGRRLQR